MRVMRLFRRYRKRISVALLCGMVVLPLVMFFYYLVIPAEEVDGLEIVAGEQVKVEEIFVDPDNYIYPYNQMSSDWGVELYESGFKYYHLPEEYIKTGGCFPEVVQAYTWSLCKERALEYPVVLAMVEEESSYRYDNEGDNGNSKGYMQVQERWHRGRMQAEGVEDLYDPYGNIRVGLSFLQELKEKYPEKDTHFILMCYNMGESKAKEFYYRGIYNTEYSRGVITRAQEIKQELGI